MKGLAERGGAGYVGSVVGAGGGGMNVGAAADSLQVRQSGMFLTSWWCVWCYLYNLRHWSQETTGS